MKKTVPLFQKKKAFVLRVKTNFFLLNIISIINKLYSKFILKMGIIKNS